MDIWIKDRWATIVSAWKSHPWLYTIPFVVGFLDMCPIWSKIISIIPGRWWVDIWLVVIVIMLLDYATLLRLRPLKAFREFANTTLQRIDVLSEAENLDLEQVNRAATALNVLFNKALGNQSPYGHLQKHRMQFMGSYEQIVRPNVEKHLNEEQQRRVLHSLRQFAERVTDSAKPKDLLPGWDVSGLEEPKRQL